jgi:hypothetical protein
MAEKLGNVSKPDSPSVLEIIIYQVYYKKNRKKIKEGEIIEKMCSNININLYFHINAFKLC